MTGQHMHTADNAVPSVDGTPLGDVLTGLAGFHPGIDLIRDGLRLLAHDRLTTDQTQTLCAVLAGSQDSGDLLTAVGLLVARLTNADTNPCLRSITPGRQKQAEGLGAHLAFKLADHRLHQHASEAAAAIDGN